MRSQARSGGQDVTDQLHDVEHATVRVLAGAPNLDEARSAILAGICAALDWQVGALWVVDTSTDGAVLTCVDIYHRDDPSLIPFAEMTRELRLERGIGLPGRVWGSKRPEWLRDVTVEPELPRSEAAAHSGLHGGVGFPIIVGGEVFGVMEFFSARVREPDGELLNTLERIGSQIGAFVEREQLGRRLVLHAALLESQGEAAIDGILIVSPQDRILYWNTRFVEIWDIPEELMRAGDRQPVIERKALLTEDPEAFKHNARAIFDDADVSRREEIRLADGRVIDRWTAPVRGADGAPLGRVLYYRDVTAQKRAEERLRDNERWSSFLAEVATVMSQTLDYTNLDRFARMVVPMLGDWCAIHLLNDMGDLELVALAHSSPDRLAHARRIQESYPIDLGAGFGLAAAVSSRESLLFEEIRDEMLAVVAKDTERLEHLRSLAFRSAMVVPLVCRDSVLGTLTLLTSESDHRYGKEDLRRAEDLAARVAYPIDNARLYQRHARVSTTLQQSLLPPELPEIPGVELAARYHAVAQTAEVGGDFYDVFPAGARSWGLALGDVSGKGVEAAAVTSLARHTVRAATMATQRPSEILSMLNAALLEETERDRFCTAVYALIEPGFGRVKVTVACGGHPVPYVIRSNGALEPVECEGTLLGVVADPELNDISIELDFGDKLIFYTDGVFDVRPRDARFGQSDLEQLFASCSKRGVKAAADLVERSVLELQEGQARDDFALVIVGVRASIFRRARTPRLWRREQTNGNA